VITELSGLHEVLFYRSIKVGIMNGLHSFHSTNTTYIVIMALVMLRAGQ